MIMCTQAHVDERVATALHAERERSRVALDAQQARYETELAELRDLVKRMEERHLTEMTRLCDERDAAVADNAALANALTLAVTTPTTEQPWTWNYVETVRLAPHTGAALLEERTAIRKSLQSRDMAGDDLAADVEAVLVSYGQALRTMTTLTDQRDELKRLMAENGVRHNEQMGHVLDDIEAWKSATGLERGGDLDGVRPKDVEAELSRLRAQVAAGDALRDEAIPFGHASITTEDERAALLRAMAVYDAAKGAS